MFYRHHPLCASRFIGLLHFCAPHFPKRPIAVHVYDITGNIVCVWVMPIGVCSKVCAVALQRGLVGFLPCAVLFYNDALVPSIVNLVVLNLLQKINVFGPSVILLM
jgi:hypothetical protein